MANAAGENSDPFLNGLTVEMEYVSCFERNLSCLNSLEKVCRPKQLQIGLWSKRKDWFACEAV